MEPASQFFKSYSLPDDKFHDHCGVFAVYGHPEAAKLTYLGLYALQHRGQESAGIAVSNGQTLVSKKGMGHVDEVFPREVIDSLPGHIAIGHTRYSTAGDTDLKNAQPLKVSCHKGQVALAHNGNLVNAAAIRRELESRGDIFQTTSDTEVILHFFAHDFHYITLLRGYSMIPSAPALMSLGIRSLTTFDSTMDSTETHGVL